MAIEYMFMYSLESLTVLTMIHSVTEELRKNRQCEERLNNVNETDY